MNAGPWHNWYHCTANTYGTWLRGDPRGWRSQGHREHVEGDYRNPPPQGMYDDLYRRSQSLMKRGPIHLQREARRLALEAVIKKLLEKNIDTAVAAMDDHHLHVIVQCCDRRPRHWIGLAKKNSAWALRDAGLTPPGGVWAKRGLCKPINDEAHFHRAVRYVRDHINQGAAIWTPAGGFQTPS